MESTAGRILDVATDLFSRIGYDGVGIRDIARDAEVTPGAINYYFGRKELLFRECVSELVRRYVRDAQGYIDRDDLCGLYMNFQTWAARNPQLLRLWVSAEISDSEDRREFIHEHVAMPIWKILAHEIPVGAQPEDRMMLLTFIGSVLMAEVVDDNLLRTMIGGAGVRTDEVWSRMRLDMLSLWAMRKVEQQTTDIAV
ncbi:MAG TPA: TetR/AcrR family transcriptional regulator [Deltaproteobacteria bacterium]|nr:TetR/AcrR family transcriptional regulator [Candidatus Binatota bacterium]HIL14443.1 TetR/AcrR family transcriptional regulator [Deltaproteobacteria bacterium]